MGIGEFEADLIIREHKFRPLPRTVHLLGRQTVGMGFEQAVRIFRDSGVDPAPTPLEIDQTTSFAIRSSRPFITDTTFFGMLGVEKIHAIDHSDFEGADIILDLNAPIPDELAGTIQFLYGGSVLDNVFDPVSYLKNVARLLPPGGRLVDLASFRWHPYVIPTPAWYFDYFVLNGFDDCKIYVIHGEQVMQVYGLIPDPDDPFICDIGSAGCGIAVIAEKGATSSWHRVPSQDQYRGPTEWSEYRDKLGRIMTAARPYNAYARPSAGDLARMPLRWTRSFRYLGTLNPDREGNFGGTIPQPARTGLKIIEASYGLNLLGQLLLRPGLLPICAGNVTEQLAALLNGSTSVDWTVECEELGDPAPQMGKDLRVSYIYLDDPEHRIREVRIPAEAHGKRLSIPPLAVCSIARECVDASAPETRIASRPAGNALEVALKNALVARPSDTYLLAQLISVLRESGRITPATDIRSLLGMLPPYIQVSEAVLAALLLTA